MNAPNNTGGNASAFEFDALSLAHNYRRALLREFDKQLAGTVIEVGAGVGQFTALLRQRSAIQQVVAVEPNADFCQSLIQTMPDLNLVQGSAADLPASTEANAILSVNVLEHIQEDELELQRYAALLRPRGGHLCLFAPARQEIYAPLDADFGHWRRYSKRDLKRKLEQAGFHIEQMNYFNVIGYFAWWLNFCLLKQRHFSPAAVSFFDRVIFPITYWCESHICWPPIGQNVLVIAKVKAS